MEKSLLSRLGRGLKRLEKQKVPFKILNTYQTFKREINF